jgi:hypothetical protein
LRIADDYEKAMRTRRTLRQTQKVLARLHEELAGESLSEKTLRAYCAEWLTAKKPELSSRTYHDSRGIGKSGRRRINELSFHSLRRTATTLLHEAGVPPTVAQALIGHDSQEVHHDYIGIGREALRSAVNRFPKL